MYMMYFVQERTFSYKLFQVCVFFQVTGEAGSGKTQLLVNALACSVTKEPVEGSASKSCQKEARSVVISTEGSFPAERLKQMIASFKSRYKRDQEVAYEF